MKQDHSIGSMPVIAALAFKSLADNSHSLHLLHRYEVSLDRQYSRALNNLLKVRAARNENSPPPPAAPVETVGIAPDLAEEVETPPAQALPNEANLPRKSARKPVEILRRRPISAPPTTPPTPNRLVPAPQTAPPTPPRKK